MGIGAATARRFSQEGSRVVIADLDGERARDIARELCASAVGVDVVDPSAVRAAVAKAEALAGPIDVLVNCAGADRLAFFIDTDADSWNLVLDVNLRGTLTCTHAVLPDMYRRRSGAIGNVASEAGRVGAVGGAVYSAAKAGVLGFAEAIARESARYGVRVNAVAPGPVGTPLMETAVRIAGQMGARLRQGMIDATAMRRVATPEEVAAVIAFLASEEASYITGETVAVSGGLSMW